MIKFRIMNLIILECYQVELGHVNYVRSSAVAENGDRRELLPAFNHTSSFGKGKHGYFTIFKKLHEMLPNVLGSILFAIAVAMAIARTPQLVRGQKGKSEKGKSKKAIAFLVKSIFIFFQFSSLFGLTIF